MKKILVAGAGLVGKAIAVDLAKKFDVSVVDRSVENLMKLPKDNISIITADFNSKKDFERVLNEFDLIVGALPGNFGFEFIKTCIELKKNVAAISFCKEDVLELNELALGNDVTVVFDCGVAPGLSNMILGHYNSIMSVNSFKCYVGGLPVKRDPPFEYKAPFSLGDVIEEYLRPARLMVNGKPMVKPALSEPELLSFDGIGELEAFNTDGLRSLLKTMSVSNMSEKTLRYPGHRDKIQLLKDAGFFDGNAYVFGGHKITPLDITLKLLADKWKLENGEEEFTVMKIIIEGVSNGKELRKEYNLYDKYDSESKTSSMARTTGYVCTAVVNLMAEGKITQKGVIAPEFIGAEKEHFDFILDYLKERKIELSFLEKS
jgi:saccharopine dehydrogenase-like NADP-dependent oxidoreductase